MKIQYLINIVLIAVSGYMLYRVIRLSGRSKQNKKMLEILDQFDDKDTFFSRAEEYISTSRDAEYVQKVSVLRLWGDAFYERDEDFLKHLSELDIDVLLNPDGRHKGYTANEDSFFYLYMALANRLFFRKRNDLRDVLYEKLQGYEERNRDTLLRKICEENRKYYAGTDDRGEAFMRSLLEGDYGGYQYSRQLVGLYKHCEEALLANICRDRGDLQGYQECVDDLDDFGRNTRLGRRWLKECGITLPEKEEAKEEDSEVNDAETGSEAQQSEDAQTEKEAETE